MEALNPWFWLSKMTRKNGVANLLILVVISLAIVLTLEALHLKENVQEYISLPKVEARPLKPIEALQKKQMVSANQYHIISTTPLFHADRKPIVIKRIVRKKKEKPLGSYELTGVVITPNRRSVLLKNSKNGEEKKVYEGEKHGDWVVSKINQNTVTLKHGQRIEVINLSEEKKKKRNKKYKNYRR